MSNSFLFFIVIVEAIIIIWLASKLSQYKRIDQLLAAKESGNSADSASGSTGKTGSLDANAVRSGDARPAGSMSHHESESAVDVEPEENIEEAKQLQWVMARCRYAEFYLEQLDDDYERGQFRYIVDGCVAKARAISDPFFNASALQAIIVLLDTAGWEQYRDSLLAEVKDDIVRERIESDIGYSVGA